MSTRMCALWISRRGVFALTHLRHVQLDDTHACGERFGLEAIWRDQAAPDSAQRAWLAARRSVPGA